MVTIRAGELDQRVTIQRPVSRGQRGEAKPSSWVDVDTVWASIEPLAGREYFAADAVQSEVTHTVRMRYRTGITGKMQIVLGSRKLQIVGPPKNIEEADVVLELMCKEQE